MSTAGPHPRFGRVDAVVVAALLVGMWAYVWIAVPLGGRPEEDAAMLLRYSQHLAAGHGIVWNIGEAPLDGATDFLFMIAVALLQRAGLELVTAAQAIGLASHAATVVLVYLGPRLLGVAPPLALVGAAVVATGPGLRHLAASYGTPLFALWATVAYLLAVRLALTDRSELARPSLAFSLAALVLGLSRPEGVFLGAFCLLSVLLVRRGDGSPVILTRFLAVFLTLGVAYFLWRWQYFGHPLPNPFYKKGGGVLHLHSLRMAVRDLWHLAAPFVAVLAVALLDRRARRLAVLTLVPVVLFTALWILIADETNYVARFRYPLVPLILVGFGLIARELLARLPSRRRWASTAAWTTAVLATAAITAWQHERYGGIVPRRKGLVDVARVLRDYDRYNYALVTTEAGLLPLYSTWRSVDAWGLNDAFIAHNGGVTEGYLDRYRPEVILFHAYFSPHTPQEGPRIENRALGPAWYRMVMTLKRYAESRDYTLVAVFGRNAWDTHWWYVRSGFPHHDAIAARIRALDYRIDGHSTVDFAADP